MTTKLTSGKKRKLINVHLLDGSEFVVHVDVKSKFQEVFNQLTGHLSLRETEYFGLAFKKDNEYQFVLLDEKIHKHAPKHWKSGPGEGVDSQGKAIISVWFRVQFYVDQVILLREKVTRHQYYLQLKENVLQYNHVYSEEKCFQQAAYALQADFGNYVREKHDGGYFNPTIYFPRWILERHGLDYLAHNVPTLHRDLHNMTRNDAELRYIRNASIPPGALNLHFYMVRKHKTDKHCNTWLAICAKGVEVYEDDAGYKNHVSTFMWRDIGKLYFDKKKFEIRCVQSSGGRRFDYYTDCDVKSKYLLSICRSTHMFQMSTQPKLMEIQHMDNEDQKRYRESCVSSEPRDRKHFHHSPSTSTNASVSSNNQRLSVVSDASSNTTSGIVSDRMVVSFDDGDDHSREVMMDCSAQLPKQMRSKLQLFSGFNQSPHYSSQVSPNHNLELFKMKCVSGSTQEHVPTHTAGCSSWHARHSHTSGCLLGTARLAQPSPITHTQDSKSCLQVGQSVSRKDSFGKLFHGSLLQTVDRNTSGDSAVSVSGVYAGPDKLSPMLLLPPLEQQTWSGKPGADKLSPMLLLPPLEQPTWSALTGDGLPATASPNFSHTLPVNQLTQRTHGSSPPPVLNFISPMKKVSSPQTVLTSDKTLSTPPDVTEKLISLEADILREHRRPVAPPRSESEQVHFKPSSSPPDLSKMTQQIKSHEDICVEQLKQSSPAPSTISLQQTNSFLKSDSPGNNSLQEVKTGIEQPSGSVQLNPEKQQIIKTQAYQSTYRPQQVPQIATEHYLMALHQGSGKISCQKGLAEMLPQQINTGVHVKKQSHEAKNPELRQQTEHLNQQPHSQPEASIDYVQEMEGKITNISLKEKNEDDGNAQPHGKTSLHPELKHILGQSHAFSLPLMTALCNDSTLMQASRSQSGSRSSYETSTMRSTDSRLTRLSHDTDSRRWSSCCQTTNVPDVMLLQSSRPYSWHSEHFELDSQLALPSSDHLPPSPPNHRNVNNKHLNMLNNHQTMLPQKMIVSDPGPSSPRLLTMGGGTCWWEAPPSASEIDATLSSWTGIIPYSLPSHGGQRQQMVPHRLSSGGHRESETSIAHKQVMKENIGIA